MLGGSVAQQGMSQNTALQAQVHTLQSQIDVYWRTISDLRCRLESFEKRGRGAEVGDDNDSFDKGNIRVFCRVRPVLSSNVVSSTSTNDMSSLMQELSRLKEEIQEHITCQRHRFAL